MNTDQREWERQKAREKRLREKDSLGLMKQLPEACQSEGAAVAFLERQRWGDAPACPHCGDLNVYQMTDRQTGERNRRFLWRCGGCGSQFTVRIGTVFEDSRIPLRHWCYAFWAACASKKGVSALQIRRQTQVSYKSALFMMHRIRYAMAPDAPTAPKLTGTVEVDETFIGGKARPVGTKEWRRLKRMGVKRVPRAKSTKIPVMAMIQRDGEVRAQVMPDVTAKNVSAVLLANVAPDASIMTDEGSHYKRVGRRYSRHQSVKHGIFEYVRDDVHVNTAEGFFSRLKRQLYGTHHAVSKKHLHRYVAEVAFKHNTRKLDDGQRIRAAIRAADGKRLMYREPVRGALVHRAASPRSIS